MRGRQAQHGISGQPEQAGHVGGDDEGQRLRKAARQEAAVWTAPKKGHEGAGAEEAGYQNGAPDQGQGAHQGGTGKAGQD